MIGKAHTTAINKHRNGQTNDVGQHAKSINGKDSGTKSHNANDENIQKREKDRKTKTEHSERGEARFIAWARTLAREKGRKRRY